MSNIAQEIIKPDQPGIFRTIFLNVGQGDSTLMAIPDGNNYKFMLIDCNIDKNANEIDLVKMLTDLLGKEKLDIFVNTHPHKDHLEGIKEIYDSSGIKEIWHSGHSPKGKHADEYKEFKEILNSIGEENVFEFLGSNDLNKLDKGIRKIGDIDYQILSPAKHVCEDIEEGDAEEQYRRIHEQCGVIRFCYGNETKYILITGDAEYNAWKNHITEYHEAHLKSEVLQASHHGSRTFFKESKDDESYLEHIKLISPAYVIVSAPKQENSPHDHPHDDAMKIYGDHVEADNLIHLGKNEECVIVDIDQKGNIEVKADKELVAEYGFKDKDNDNKNNFNKSYLGIQTTKLDDKPMGKI